MSNGKLLHGQQFDPRDPVVKRFTQRMMDKESADALLGDAFTEILPTDQDASKVTVFDGAGIQALLDAEMFKLNGQTSLDLPNVLTGVTITYNSAEGEGASNHPASQQASSMVGDSVSGGLNPRASAQGSASIIPDAQPIIERIRATDIPCTECYFYMPEGFTRAQLLTKLAHADLMGATVLSLPVWKEKSVTLTLKGQSASVSVQADTSVAIAATQVSASAQSAYGDGYSEEVSTSVKTVFIPPTLHAGITLVSTSDTVAASVEVDASTPAISGGAGDFIAAVGAISNAPAERTKTITASVTPTTIPATSPTGIPTSGLYLTRLRSTVFEFDRVFVLAEVVDFSIFA